jgi:hypothetical protein
MRKLLVALVVVGFGWVAVSLNGADEKPSASIKEVMKVAMKGGLCKKVADGKASEEEKKQLAGLFAALHAGKPPRGDESAFKEKAKALVDACNDVLAGKEGAGAKLAAAANCMACHKDHK